MSISIHLLVVSSVLHSNRRTICGVSAARLFPGWKEAELRGRGPQSEGYYRNRPTKTERKKNVRRTFAPVKRLFLHRKWQTPVLIKVSLYTFGLQQYRLITRGNIVSARCLSWEIIVENLEHCLWELQWCLLNVKVIHLQPLLFGPRSSTTITLRPCWQKKNFDKRLMICLLSFLLSTMYLYSVLIRSINNVEYVQCCQTWCNLVYLQ